MLIDEESKRVIDRIAELVMSGEIHFDDDKDGITCVSIIPDMSGCNKGCCWSAGIVGLESNIDIVDPERELFKGYDNSDGLGLDSAWYNISDGKLFFDVEWTDKNLDKSRYLSLEIPVSLKNLGRFQIEYHDTDSNKDVVGFVSNRFDTLYDISKVILKEHEKNLQKNIQDGMGHISIRSLEDDKIIYTVVPPLKNQSKWYDDYLI